MHEILIRDAGYPVRELPAPAEKITTTMIDSYSFRLEGLNGKITGPQQFEVLNAFAERLSELSEYERVLLAGAVELTDCRSIEVCDLLMSNLDCFELTPDAGNYETLGRDIATTMFADIHSDILEHLDYAQLGRLKYDNGMSVFVDSHCVCKTSQEFREPTPGADSLQGYTLKLRLTSDANPDGVWIKFPLY
jgi:hypothetical protein